MAGFTKTVSTLSNMSSSFSAMVFGWHNKKRNCVGKTKYDKGTKLVAITEKRGRPISVLISSASCHEVDLIETVLDSCFVSATPAVLTRLKTLP